MSGALFACSSSVWIDGSMPGEICQPVAVKARSTNGSDALQASIMAAAAATASSWESNRSLRERERERERRLPTRIHRHARQRLTRPAHAHQPALDLHGRHVRRQDARHGPAPRAQRQLQRRRRHAQRRPPAQRLQPRAAVAPDAPAHQRRAEAAHRSSRRSDARCS